MGLPQLGDEWPEVIATVLLSGAAIAAIWVLVHFVVKLW